MTAKPINPYIRSALEYGPVIAFFAAYLWLKDRSFVIGGTEYDGFIVVTAGFTSVDPLKATDPTPLSMLALSAPLVLQLNVDVPPL